MPTVLDVLGAHVDQITIDGKPLPSQEGADPEHMVFVRLLDDVETSAVIEGRLKLVSREGKLLLFDLVADPMETQNISGKVDAHTLNVALKQFSHQIRLQQAGKVTTSMESQ